MSDNRKYYYLKLKENFFESDEIVMLESMQDGYLYSNILLKLYLRSLKNEGKLVFNDRIPFNPTMLSMVTRHNVGTVEKALDIFRELGLVEILDNGAIYMMDIQNFIGQSSTEGDRKRRYRNKIEQEKNMIMGQMSRQMSRQMSGQTSDKHPPEIELEIEIEKDIENNISVPDIEGKSPKIDYEKVKKMYNTICTSLPKVKTLSDKRKKLIKARYIDLDKNIDAFENLFIKVNQSDFLSGRSGKWACNFDWILKSGNFIKIMEDTYQNKGGFNNQIQRIMREDDDLF